MAFDILLALIAILTMVIPGIAAGFALLHGLSFSRIEKTILGMILSIMLIPMLMFGEYLALGLLFSLPLYFANVLLVLLGSLGAYYYQTKQIRPNLKLPNLGLNLETLKRYGPIAFVLLAMVLGAYIRFAPAVGSNGSFNTAFFEFDPYYYMKLTERLIQYGQIPLFSDDSYFPQTQFQRWPPLSQYMTGSWLATYDALTGQGYDQNNLIFVSDFYPPLVAALMGFIVFLLVRERYNAYFGAIGAALIALTPQLIQKFGYGETLEQPFGVYLALLFFGILVLALKRNSFRLGLFAGITAMAAVFGSQQYIWPYIVFFAFITVQSALYFLSNDFQNRKWVILTGLGASFLAAHTIMAFYDGQNFFRLLDSPTLSLMGSMLFSVTLFLVGKHLSKKQNSFDMRLKTLGAVLLVGLLVLIFTPLGTSLVSSFQGVASESTNANPISKTIAEEGAPTPDIYPLTFGVLDPRLLLLLTAILPMLSASIILFCKKRENLGVAFLGVGFFLIVLKGFINNAITAMLGNSQAILNKIILLFITNDTSIYIVMGLVSAGLIYLLEDGKQRSEFLVLMMLVIYPVAFIGTNRLKFLLHMSLALALSLPLVLGELQKVLEQLNKWFNVFNQTHAFRSGVIGLLLFTGLLASAAQGQFIQSNMNQLTQTKLPADWVDTYNWVRTSSPSNLRMMSWWDYGHWTTFLGHRKTVLNPSNVKDYDQGVARAYVNGNPKDIYDLMDYHHATHILVDGDLISKWGALVFLSGTCIYSNDTANSNRFICPKVPDIDPNQYPGASKYEIEHSFEQLQLSQSSCPATVVGVPLPMVQSTFGARYCLTDNLMIFVSSQGIVSNLTRPYKLAGRDNFTTFDPEISYLYQTGPNSFININPYYDPFGYHDFIFDSVYTRLFFTDTYPGFKLAYRSPNSYVKIFEYSGRPLPASLPPIAPIANPVAANATGGNPSKVNATKDSKISANASFG